MRSNAASVEIWIREEKVRTICFGIGVSGMKRDGHQINEQARQMFCSEHFFFLIMSARLMTIRLKNQFSLPCCQKKKREEISAPSTLLLSPSVTVELICYHVFETVIV